jgi:hypothetical protein
LWNCQRSTYQHRLLLLAGLLSALGLVGPSGWFY